jgi:hypothetical protein
MSQSAVYNGFNIQITCSDQRELEAYANPLYAMVTIKNGKNTQGIDVKSQPPPSLLDSKITKEVGTMSIMSNIG